jgi:exodeoxyribonuclease-1
LAGTVDEVRAGVFTPAADRSPGDERIPLMTVATNKVPMLAPLGTLKGADLERIGLDRERCLENARTLLASREALKPTLRKVYERPPPEGPGDPDGALYTGPFFSRKDKAGFARLRAAAPETLGRFDYPFDDSRIDEMIFRYRARNWPETLSSMERQRWDKDRLGRLRDPAVPGRLTESQFREELAETRTHLDGETQALALLDEVARWVDECVLDDPAETPEA